MQDKKQDAYAMNANKIVACFAPAEFEVEHGMSKTKTLWGQQAVVYASSETGEARRKAFNMLLLGRSNACVLISGKPKEVAKIYPVATEISHGNIPRIFNTADGQWAPDKALTFSMYKHVIVVNPEGDDPLAGLAKSMGESFSLIRDNTNFIINNIGW